MNRIRNFNCWTERHPGKTLLAIFIVFAIACSVIPADPAYLSVAGAR